MTRVTEARFEPMQAHHLDAVLAVEALAHPHPWGRAHFTDALEAHNEAQLLMAGDQLLGYFVALPGVGEAHLLNITVAPAYQRQGWSRVMLDALAVWARSHHATQVWLEVRVGNARAQQVYAVHGFRRVSVRKAYYPANQGLREDAVVMVLTLADAQDSHGA